MTRSMYTVPVRYPAGLLIAVVVVAFAVGLARRAEADGEFLRLLHCEEFFHRATDWWATDAKPKGFRHRFDVNRCFVESPTGTHEAAGHAFTPISTSFDVATSVASERIPVQASSSMYPFPTTYTRYVIETKAKCAADPWQFPAVRSACTRLSARWGYGWDSAPTKPLFLAAAVVLPVSAAGGGPASVPMISANAAATSGLSRIGAVSPTPPFRAFRPGPRPEDFAGDPVDSVSGPFWMSGGPSQTGSPISGKLSWTAAARSGVPFSGDAAFFRARPWSASLLGAGGSPCAAAGASCAGAAPRLARAISVTHMVISLL